MLHVFYVSDYTILYRSKIAPANEILRSIIYSFFALFIISIATAVLYSRGVGYFLDYAFYDIPRFLMVGFIVGSILIRNSKTEKIEKAPLSIGKHTKKYSVLAVLLIVGFALFSNYQTSQQPASFTASGIHFVTSGGIITVVANITNISTFSLIQVDASINGVDDGICGYGSQDNQWLAALQPQWRSPSCWVWRDR